MKIDKEIADLIRAAPGHQTLCFVLEWDQSAALRSAEGLASPKDRRDAIHRALSKAKESLLDALKSEPMADVNDLEGTGQAVVAAPAHLWQSLFDDPQIEAANVRILPNERFRALD